MEQTRVVEAFVGEYASGKSENAVNRALALYEQGHRPLTLIDLDVDEPTYTLRPIKAQLEQAGLQVIAWETRQTQGLGEAGSTIHPDVKWSLRREGHLVYDVGYGVYGSRTLNLVEEIWECPELKVYMVINLSRPMTSSIDRIVDEVRAFGRVDALINNTHLGDESTLELIYKGADTVTEAARILGIPVMATATTADLAALLRQEGRLPHPIWPLKRFMPQTFW